MIRVLLVLGGLDRGGAETMVMNLYRAIDRTQIQFDFIIHNDKHQAYYDEIISLGGKIFHFPAFKGLNYFSMRKIWKNFFKDHPEYKILHSHVRSYASLYLPIAKKAGLKTIIHSHSTSNGKGFASVIKWLMQYRLRYQADYFFGCSKEAGEWLFGKKVVNGPTYHILPNAIDTEKYKFNPQVRREYREQLGLGEKKTFIHVGRFHPAKNHSFLLDLFAKVHGQDANTVLLLAGDGELRSVIESKIAELNLKKDVVLLGCRDDVPKLLQAADCFLFPSLWEGLGMVAIEAQAAGLPCICSSAVPVIVKMSENCLFLSFKDVDFWIESLMKMSRLNSDESTRIVERIIREGFDIGSTSKKMIDFYTKIFNERKNEKAGEL